MCFGLQMTPWNSLDCCTAAIDIVVIWPNWDLEGYQARGNGSFMYKYFFMKNFKKPKNASLLKYGVNNGRQVQWRELLSFECSGMNDNSYLCFREHWELFPDFHSRNSVKSELYYKGFDFKDNHRPLLLRVCA